MYPTVSPSNLGSIGELRIEIPDMIAGIPKCWSKTCGKSWLCIWIWIGGYLNGIICNLRLVKHLLDIFSRYFQRNFRLQIAKVNDDGLQVLQELRLYHPSVDPEDASKSDKATASPPWWNQYWEYSMVFRIHGWCSPPNVLLFQLGVSVWISHEMWRRKIFPFEERGMRPTKSNGHKSNTGCFFCHMFHYFPVTYGFCFSICFAIFVPENTS